MGNQPTINFENEEPSVEVYYLDSHIIKHGYDLANKRYYFDGFDFDRHNEEFENYGRIKNVYFIYFYPADDLNKPVLYMAHNNFPEGSKVNFYIKKSEEHVFSMPVPFSREVVNAFVAYQNGSILEMFKNIASDKNEIKNFIKFYEEFLLLKMDERLVKTLDIWLNTEYDKNTIYFYNKNDSMDVLFLE